MQRQFLSSDFFNFPFVLNKTEHVGEALVRNTQEARREERQMTRFLQHYQPYTSNILSTAHLGLQVLQLPCKSSSCRGVVLNFKCFPVANAQF